MLRFVRAMLSAARVTPSGMNGPMEQLMISKITASFAPELLVVYNDSQQHAHHAAMKGAANVKELHFRVEIVSDKFKGMGLPARHRAVYKALDEEMADGGIHALQLKTKTPEEMARQSA